VATTTGGVAHRQRVRTQVSMDVAANDVEAELGNRKGRFWSDVGGVLGAVVAILWSDGRRRVEDRQWQVGFVGE
jgi:sorbitol-specific phosphotransferase system component IIBC